jgi:putative ABC transport system substrate-binding protein
MRRRKFIMFLGGAAVAPATLWPLGARAQPAGKVWRIGMLETTPLTLNGANLESFRKGLRELGYIEGQNLIIDYRSADGRNERFPDLAAELVRLKVDVIVTRGTVAALAAKNAVPTTPVVMAASGEPVGTGVVAGLARPGGNVTGLSAVVSELEPKRVELLRDLLPRFSRLAALYNMGNPVGPPRWEMLKQATASLGIEPRLLDIRKADDLRRAFDAASAQHADALVVANDTVTIANRRQVVELAAKHRLPAAYASREFVDAGGMMTYGVHYPDLYRRAATFVDKILKGARPADLPVEQPTRFELVINLKTARALGLEVPGTLLARADVVIE